MLKEWFLWSLSRRLRPSRQMDETVRTNHHADYYIEESNVAYIGTDNWGIVRQLTISTHSVTKIAF